MLCIIVNKSIVDMLWAAECQEVDMSTFVDLCAQGKAFYLKQQNTLIPLHPYMLQLSPDPTGSMHFVQSKYGNCTSRKVEESRE